MTRGEPVPSTSQEELLQLQEELLQTLEGDKSTIAQLESTRGELEHEVAGKDHVHLE